MAGKVCVEANADQNLGRTLKNYGFCRIMAPLRYMTTSYVRFYGIAVMSLLSIKMQLV
ncbi:hypothetical protein CULC0102_1403 [Corynebacterium ulcerans 0102]|nr:hypothetical protein CULC0102_1403 [Corynebacterium ulcerans 0102]